MKIWQRIKNLWYLSGLPKGAKGYPDEYERGFQAGEMHLIGNPKKMATIVDLSAVDEFAPDDEAH